MKELALHIMDVAQNSIRARATVIDISISESNKNNRLVIEIRDNGEGIPDEILTKITDPYTTSRTTRKVGLGLPLLRHHVELTGGRIGIYSQQGRGTRVEAIFVKDHIDLQPLGDLPGVIKLLLAANPEIDFTYTHETDNGKFIFSSAEAREMLEVKAFNDYSLLEQIKELLIENLTDIGVDL